MHNDDKYPQFFRLYMIHNLQSGWDKLEGYLKCEQLCFPNWSVGSTD